MPFPGEVGQATLNDPFGANTGYARAQAAAGGPAPVAAAAAPVGGWPAGLAPSQAAAPGTGGLPAHLSASMPAPLEDPNAGIVAAGPAAPEVDEAALAEIQARIVGGPVATPAPTTPPSVQLSQEPEGNGHLAKIYQLALSQDELRPGTEQDGLIWKIACKSGTLALSPGPGQIAVDKPLVLDTDLFNEMVLSLQEKALPYCTVPETHGNGSLENTGYVKEAEVLTKAQTILDTRISEKAREVIAADPDETTYLLAGIDFTNPKAKEKALEGSIPDVSIGVKFGWRNTRTGKFFKAAWEHLALTPMPWMDGLPAFGLSAEPGVFDAEQALERYDGVYVDMPAATEPFFDAQGNQIHLAMRINMRGDDYSSEKAKTAIAALQPGDEWSWSYGVTVQRVQVVGSEAGSYLFRAGHHFDDPPTIYTGLDALMPAVDAAVQAHEAREATRRMRDQLAEQGIAVAYSQDDEGEGLDLAIQFDPAAHPRDLKGQFKSALGKLKPGERLELPDGTAVTKGKDNPGYFEFQRPATEGEHKSGVLPKSHKTTSAGTAHTKDSTAASRIPEGELQDLDGVAEKALRISTAKGTEDFGHEDQAAKNGQKTEETSQTLRARTIADLEKAYAAAQKSGDAKKRSEIFHRLRKLRASDTNLSQGDTLPEGDGNGTVALKLSATSEQEEPRQMPTAEEILAQQQADMEQMRRELEETRSALALSQGTINSQSEQLRTDWVAKRIRKAQLDGVSPTLCLAARALLLNDKTPIAIPEGQGLNLAITTGEGDAAKTTTFQRPTDIVEFMLSAASGNTGDAAAVLASLTENLDILALAQQPGATEPSEADRIKQLDEWEREQHPERFGTDGKRITD